MDTPLQTRLRKLEYACWENGESIAYPRNPDGYEAFVYISQLEAKVADLETEIQVLDEFLEKISKDGKPQSPF